MAISGTLKRAGKFWRTFDITATLDADANQSLTHGLATRTGGLAILNPDTEIGSHFEGLLPTQVQLSGWSTASRTATTVVVAKTTAVGTGNAAAQTRLHVYRIAALNG